MYEYLIVYNDGESLNNVDVTLDSPITGIADIRALEEKLAIRKRVSNALITNFILLSGPES